MSSRFIRARPRTPGLTGPSPSPATPPNPDHKNAGPDPDPSAHQIQSEAAPKSASFSSSSRATPPRPTFASLPTEIHLLIAQQLIYPDALSLKHTSRHFYRLVDTGVRLKVAWLMERRLLHLECPSDSRCDLGSDLRFCRGSVKYNSHSRLLMRRRREHVECESRPGLGCLIYGTSTCPHARQLKTRLKKWLRGHPVDRARWPLLLAASMVPLLVGWVWMMVVMLF